jgi:hypothetical protein
MYCPLTDFGLAPCRIEYAWFSPWASPHPIGGAGRLIPTKKNFRIREGALTVFRRPAAIADTILEIPTGVALAAWRQRSSPRALSTRQSRGSTPLRAGRPGSRAAESAPYGIEAAARLPSADQPHASRAPSTTCTVSRPVRVLLLIVKLDSPVPPQVVTPPRSARSQPPQPVHARRE